MFPPRLIILALVPLVCGRFVLAQTVINSEFVLRRTDQYPGAYDDLNHWNPAEVPNNTPAKLFNVNIDTFVAVHVVNDATISNLNLSGSASAFHVFAQTFTVTGTTANQSQTGDIYVAASSSNPNAARFNAGTLTSFSNHTLRGNYSLNRGTLQFTGADVWTIRDGTLNLQAGSAIIDESGNDGLRNLAQIEASGAISLYDGKNLVTTAPFLNEGTLWIYSLATPISFTASSGLRNFDPSTKTLTGGTFTLGGDGSELRFAGADIVNLGSALSLFSTDRVVDLLGKDGLRNLASILPSGVLTLTGRDFTTVAGFTNNGKLALDRSTFTVTGVLGNFDANSRTLTGGSYSFSSSVFKFSGADIVHNQASISLTQNDFGARAGIMDLAGNDALRNFNDNLGSGSFTVNPGQLFVAPGDFTNAGKVITTPKRPTHDDRATAEFRVPAGSAYIQTGGTTINAATLTAENANILGGLFFNRALERGGFGTPSPGQVKGNLNVSGAMLVPNGVVTGNLTLGANARFHSTIGLFTDSILTYGSTALDGTLEVELTGYRFPGNSEVITLLQSWGPMSGTFSNAPNGARIKTTDGGGSFVVVYDSNAVKLTGFELSPSPAQLLNISTRAALARADDDPQGDRSVLIAGFIISGAEAKKVVVRGIGPSLAKAGVSPTLLDPTLELHASDGSTIATNNNWRDTQEADLAASGLAPQDDLEAAVLATLPPGTYTVVIREKNGLAGTGLVEVYDISGSSNSKLANISTRGFTDDANILIGGVIAGGPGQENAELVVRALGPSLQSSGVFNAVNALTLELRDANGNLVGFSQEATPIPREVPSVFVLSAGESAIRVSLPHGNYTALVRAKPGGGGVALVEFYDLRQ